MPQVSRQTGTSLSEINIVPLVDVVLVLLIIFMITAPILQSGIHVDLPQTKTVHDMPEARVIVTIDRAQLIYLGNTAVNIHDLGAKALQQLKDPAHDAVYLEADKTVPFGVVAIVLDHLKQAKIETVQIVTEPLHDQNSDH
ncbi:MAG TPA: biopolymer transporter ExbD [Candidatus Acidoferrales bacterium]|nr:biopolymer transporter ExbD [Candidatus Acidoferrales bacterium]